ncbi:SDR family oxidoreductase [Gordonia rhizosphera]|uniref:SDR family oxidoreductase n=1 Tax=Gordonia rhizosphera TaxID=83341 RepID=UPI001FDF3CD8|nr:SDR family oxidoreductase [Gordonia rhizosphera]
MPLDRTLALAGTGGFRRHPPRDQASFRYSTTSYGPRRGLTRRPSQLRGRRAVPEALSHVAACSPLGRYRTPDEVAAAVDWLMSADASFVNGAILTADGGTTA